MEINLSMRMLVTAAKVVQTVVVGALCIYAMTRLVIWVLEKVKTREREILIIKRR